MPHISPVRAGYRVYFVTTNSDFCNVRATVVLCETTCYVGPCYNDTWLYMQVPIWTSIWQPTDILAITLPWCRNIITALLSCHKYDPVTMIVPASGHQVHYIPWVQMGTFNKEIGFLCGLKFFALNIFCGEYLQPNLHLMLQIWWKPLRWKICQ